MPDAEGGRAEARWDRASELFAEAMELPAAEREAWLDRASAGDDALRREVAALLEVSADAERYFTRLADEAIPPALAALETGADTGAHTGRSYGPYRVIEEIGRGGMGIVYRAEDTRLGRMAALKFLPRAMLQHPEAEARLMHEARAASMLDHPNICTIFGFETTAEGETFIAMAYYAGETLAERIARAPLPLGEALSIATGVTRGLAAAHAHGLTHRDLTPRNVMLPARGTVKILDFGLAQSSGQAGGSAAGTPSYMPPEQLRGEGAGAAGDVWSLAVTMYELFTGRRPFEGADTAATLDAIADAEPVAPRALAPNLPEPLERLILRMLAKDAAARPADASEVLAVLEPIAQAQRGRKARLAVGSLVVALGLVVVALLATRGPAAPPGSVPAARVILLPLTSDPASADGVYLAAGLHEVISSELSRIRGLALISWTSGLPDENTPRFRRRLGRTLSAVAILEGHVSGRDSVTLRLHDARSDAVLWAQDEGFLRRGHEGVGREIALAVAAALEVPTAAAADPRVLEPGHFARDPRTGHVYEAVPVTLNWYDAEREAVARTHEGVTGHLAAITSAGENEFIRTALPEAVAGSYWLGAFRAIRGGTARDGWHWVTGEPFEYANWLRGGPNDYFGEDGLQYWAHPDSALWNDIDRTSGFEPWVKGFLVEYTRDASEVR